MALQAFSLVPVNAKDLMEITPKNWHRYPVPPPAGSYIPAYVPAVSYTGGATGDDVDTSTANSTDAYSPKTQAAKATLLNTTLAVDVARPRGVIATGQPYPITGSPAPAAPVVSSIAPTTGAASTLPLTVTITGTGFTPWSVVRTGGSAVADPTASYVNATTMKVAIMKATPGTVSVAVEDHDVLSNTNIVFTVT